MAILAPQVEASRAGSESAGVEPWQRAVRQAIRDPAELCRLLELPAEIGAKAAGVVEGFELFVPRGFAARIKPGDPHDPLLLQVLPRGEELDPQEGFVDDPVGDESAQIVPGVLHKYAGRALLVTTGACAVHCRYCFRRHFAYSDLPRSTDDWEQALAIVAAEDSIDEVILSGGDPLMLVDHRLAWLAERLASITHVKRLRVHTRLPIMIPERVNGALLDWLTGTRLAPWMVVHANHPAELDRSVLAALGRLVDAGVPVLNQAVLLKGVNDDAETLVALSQVLVDHRVMPYYLHQLDAVRGAAHFAVDEQRGVQLMAELSRRLPGYAVPRYVREQAGAAHKLSVI